MLSIVKNWSVQTNRSQLSGYFLLFLLFGSPLLSSAFTLEVESINKFRRLYVLEYNGTGPQELKMGTNTLDLENYPNVVYLVHNKGSKYDYLGLIWVEAKSSDLKISLGEDFNLEFERVDSFQDECTNIFRSADNIHRLMNYMPNSQKPLEPILAMEAKMIRQNLVVEASRTHLVKLVGLSRKHGINNWSTAYLSAYLQVPPDDLYHPDSKSLLKVQGLDEAENEVEIRPDGEKHMFVAISGSWCGPCIKSIPKMRSTYDEISNKVMFVSTWNDPNLVTFTDNHKEKKSLITWVSLWDPYGLTGKSFQTQIYPSYVLFDPQGKEVMRWSGKFPKDLADYL